MDVTISAGRPPTGDIAVCMKWTAQGPEADPGDVRFAGVSHADQAALETALVLGAAIGGSVTAVTVGPPAAERALRDAMACGATAAIRVDAAHELESVDVAGELALAVAGATVVLCGDYSTDRGTGSVPAFLASRLGAAQALGLVELTLDGESFHAVRRLDGGRREVLRVGAPCVLSVEGSVASLRRAGLRATLASATAALHVRPGTSRATAAVPTVVTPFRPRARVLSPPRGEDVLARLRELTDAVGATSAHSETVTLAPRDAAVRILAALREWDELD